MPACSRKVFGALTTTALIMTLCSLMMTQNQGCLDQCVVAVVSMACCPSILSLVGNWATCYVWYPKAHCSCYRTAKVVDVGCNWIFLSATSAHTKTSSVYTRFQRLCVLQLELEGLHISEESRVDDADFLMEVCSRVVSCNMLLFCLSSLVQSLWYVC